GTAASGIRRSNPGLTKACSRSLLGAGGNACTGRKQPNNKKGETMSKTKKARFDVQFLFEHRYNWSTIEAETIEQAMCRAEDIVAENGERYEELRVAANNYDDVGEIEAIEVKGVHETRCWTADHVKVRDAATDLLAA